MNKTSKKLKLDYVWVIISLCFLMVAVSLGFCSSGRTYYLTAITDALKLPRGAFSLNDTFRFVTTTIVNLYFGRLVGKYGIKKLIVSGFMCLIAFTVINALASRLISFYIGSIFLGVGLTFTSTTMVSVIINRWCKTNKGAITGAVLASNGIGGAIAVQVISPIIFQEGNPFGYRQSYNLVTLILAVVLVLIIIFFRDNPKDEENTPIETTKKKKARGTGWVGMDYSVGCKKSYFYAALLAVMLTGFALTGLGGIAFPHMYDVGISVEFVALISSITSIILTVSKFGVGYMYDRFGMRITMTICFICGLFSIFSLPIVSDSSFGRMVVVVRGVISCLAIPLETVMIPLYVSELFGNKSFEKFTGIFVSVNYAGYALGSPFGNIFYDVFGNYNIAFIVFGIMMLIAAVIMEYVLTVANKDKRIILDELNEKEKELESASK